MPENTAWFPKRDPWMPADYDDSVVGAIRAFASGTANAGQQATAWQWIMYVCGTSDQFADLSYRPGVDGHSSTSFAEGKRFVGLQIRKMLHPMLTPQSNSDEPTVLTRRMIGQRARRQREKIRNGREA